MNVLHEQRSNNFVKSVNVNSNDYSFFLCSEDQIEDIERFCCGDRHNSVLCIDTTFNLCKLWATDTSYRNQRLINPRMNDHPVFLGPVILHFTKDESIFKRLALEMIAFNPNIINLKKIGVDMEAAIFNGLLCVKHLSDRDKKKLISLLARTSQKENSRLKSTRDIISDIYGRKYETVFEYGLADSEDSADFESRLNTLKEKWDALCPGFMEWFSKKRK